MSHQCGHDGVWYTDPGTVEDCKFTPYAYHGTGQPPRTAELMRRRDPSLPEWELAKCYSCGARFQPMNSRQIYCDSDCRA